MAALPLPQFLENTYAGINVPVDGDICADFEAVEKSGEWFGFMSHYYMLPGEYKPAFAGGAPGELVVVGKQDYCDVRDVLYLMLQLRELATSETTTLDDLQQLNGGLLLLDETKDAATDETRVCGELHLQIRGAAYCAYLCEIARVFGEAIERDSFYYTGENSYLGAVKFVDAGEGRFVVVGKAFLLSELDTPRKVAESLLDALCAAHLKDVETFTVCGVASQRCRFGVNALWLGYCNKLAGCRVMRCEACGKPLLVTGERGTPRKYCDGTCQRWAGRHPGEKREMRVLK